MSLPTALITILCKIVYYGILTILIVSAAIMFCSFLLLVNGWRPHLYFSKPIQWSTYPAAVDEDRPVHAPGKVS